MRVVVSSLVLLFFMACSTTYPAVTYYRVTTLHKSLQKGVCKKDSIKVAQSLLPSSLMSKKMRYVVGEYEEGTFHQSAWAEELNRAISDAIVTSLRDANLFATVTSYKSTAVTEYRLESSVAEFTQHFSRDEKHSFVKLDITFMLVDNATSKVIATKHIVKEFPTQSADAKGGVRALNSALQESLREMQIWLEKSCK